ncbi:FCD domain-containing protein [Actinomadura rayongensis]|uniref:FCD domain-containing protein n=1 Tax=Actinomadura rayongensis TaxID=1429076 RepID=A0A6I4W9K6_9ACTN|nr:FCD domain-containing protein [Actinomadura rayongensis]MXQ66251.1 FCD domain-containing protein [Actinomadura rayongensis]
MGFTARCACSSPDAVQRGRVGKDEVDAGRRSAPMAASNQELHRQIREISGQETATRGLERLRAQSVRHQSRLAMHPGRSAVGLTEHVAIINAVCAQNPVATEQAMREHLASVITAMREIGERGRTGLRV